MKGHAALVFCCVAACAGNPKQRPSSEQRPTGTHLESELVAALHSGEPLVCTQAMNLLGIFGGEEHIAAIAAFTDDEYPDVRRAARQSVANLSRSPAARDALAARLHAWLGDGNRFCQQQAIWLHLRLGAGADLSRVEGMLASNALNVRATAAAVCAGAGHTLHERDRSALLAELRGTHYERNAIPLFDQVHGAQDRSLVEGYADSPFPEVAYAARATLGRLDEGEHGGPWTDAANLRRQYMEQNDAASALYLQRTWRDVPLAETVNRLAAARLVLFGEMHHDDGPLRDAQRRLLRAMVLAAPGRVVVGYEPSVRSAQESVLEEATRLGVPVVCMEPSWQELTTESRVAERDVECAQAIAACFARDPECRLLVLRGESHTLADGFLARRLTVPAKFVHTLEPPRFADIGNRPLTGRMFEVGDTGNVFYWGTEEPQDWAPMVAKWLAARAASDPVH